MITRIARLVGVFVILGTGAACSNGSTEPPASFERAPVTSTLLVRHEDAAIVSVLDTDRRAVVGTIELGGRVGPVILGADASRAFVAVPDAIAIVDVLARRVLETVALPGEATGLVQAGDLLYVVANVENRGRVSALDLRTGGVSATQTIDDLAGAPVVTADRRRLFVPHSFYTGKVTALDLPGLRVRRVPTFEDGVTRLALGQAHGYVYVPNGSSFDGRVTVVDGSTLRTLADINLPGEPTDIALHPDGRRAWVPLFRDHAIGVLDLSTNTLEQTIPVRDYPFRLAVSTDGASVFVVHNGWDALSVVDTATSSVSTIAIPSPADFIAGPPQFVDR